MPTVSIDWLDWSWNDCLMNQGWLICAAALSVPHILYAFVWLFTSDFVSICKQLKVVPCDFMAKAGVSIKLWQYAWISYWHITNGPMFTLTNQTYLRLAIGLTLVAIGQILNIAVYKTLGKDGVYYGAKLGRPVPWVNGFPFNTVRDPQYTGCILTIWGGFILVATQSHVVAGLIPMGIIW
eukprot:CAMPEP_0113935430 /NCGR_PEP_ID=MMETSP1339-20121228/2574_1 /TAXON_ID=94617 /ORGANISM="Fibrocapsa japonica" /LENGTH=180 /DNA_ID=CAMNT_0000937577 /DNA_START=125 /DNA_END=664 /DNA_ORIENTATION=+ /assembly_acc=CAM_ASM_000762